MAWKSGALYPRAKLAARLAGFLGSTLERTPASQPDLWITADASTAFKLSVTDTPTVAKSLLNVEFKPKLTLPESGENSELRARSRPGSKRSSSTKTFPKLDRWYIAASSRG